MASRIKTAGSTVGPANTAKEVFIFESPDATAEELWDYVDILCGMLKIIFISL